MLVVLFILGTTVMLRILISDHIDMSSADKMTLARLHALYPCDTLQKPAP